MHILSFFEDFLSLFQIVFFIVGFFDSEKDFFSWHSRDCFLQGEAVNGFAQLASACFP